jgi:hypothetical protein
MYTKRCQVLRTLEWRQRLWARQDVHGIPNDIPPWPRWSSKPRRARCTMRNPRFSSCLHHSLTIGTRSTRSTGARSWLFVATTAKRYAATNASSATILVVDETHHAKTQTGSWPTPSRTTRRKQGRSFSPALQYRTTKLRWQRQDRRMILEPVALCLSRSSPDLRRFPLEQQQSDLTAKLEQVTARTDERSITMTLSAENVELRRQLDGVPGTLTSYSLCMAIRRHFLRQRAPKLRRILGIGFRCSVNEARVKHITLGVSHAIRLSAD